MKFSLTKNTKVERGITLYQIKAEETKNGIKKGELGGWIEKKKNLDMCGNAWVSGNAWVCGNACVYGNARVFGDAQVSGNAQVSGDAWVFGNACVRGDAQVCGNAWVRGKLKLEFGCCFGRKRKDWNVSEVENEEEILLIKDYKPSEEEPIEEMTLEEICKALGKTIKIKKKRNN